jgi:hypothetical protein
MKWNAATAALGLVAPTHALLRFGCAQLTVQRLDPLVTPGQNPSPHLHQIIGGVRSSPFTASRTNFPGLLQRLDGPPQPRPRRAVDLH